MSQYKFTGDITDSDLLRLEIFSVAVDCDMLDAAATWESESGNYTWAHNLNGDASGINQMMPNTLKGLGYRSDISNDEDRSAAFRHETYSGQVQWAQRYYTPYKGKLKSRAAFYVATFLPADIDYASKGGPDTVLVQKGGRRGWAYTANAGFDENHDLKITVQELEDAITRACASARWEELSERISAQLKRPHVVTNVATYDLGSIKGVQQALNRLGFNVGPIDGINGHLTRLAVAAFQKSVGLTIDSVYGPDTRKALQDALNKSLATP